MKKIYHTIILAAMFAAIVSACDLYPPDGENYHRRILLENCWDRPIYVTISIDNYWYSEHFNDYFHFLDKPMKEYASPNIIMPGETDREITESFESYEGMLQDGDSAVIEVYDFQQPDKKDSECFLVYYLLSLKDLQKVNFHLTYPPNENMKDFHMKPSYEEVIRQSQTR